MKNDTKQSKAAGPKFEHLTDRERLVLQLALSYVYSNLDDLNEAFEPDEDTQHRDHGVCIQIEDGPIHPGIAENEVEALQKALGKPLS